MGIAKVVDTEDGQIVVFPKGFRFDAKQYSIGFQDGNIYLRPLIPLPAGENFSKAVEILRSLPEDFMQEEYEELLRKEKMYQEEDAR